KDPIVQDPIVQDPIVQDPIVQDPIVKDPIVQDPIVQDPIVKDPIVQDPIVKDPIVKDPIVKDPIVKDPIVQDPIVKDPIVQDPIVQDPIVKDPIVQDPIVKDPIVQDPIVKDPIVQDPIVQDPIVKDPIVKDPIVQDPIVKDPIVQDPIVKDPIVQDPIVKDPIVQDPIVKDPIVQDPIVKDPIVQDPIVQDPIIKDPIVQDPIVQDPIVKDPIVQDPIVKDPIVKDPIVQDPIVQDPIVQDPVEEQLVEFDQALWDFISSQETPADPLPEEVEPPNNQKPIWTKQLGSSAIDRPRGVAVDAFGNVYMAGGTLGSLDGNVNASGSGSNQSDPFITKYDVSGNKIWTRQIGSTGWDFYTDVTVDGVGNVYTVGENNGLGTVNGAVTLTKWNSNGGQLWNRVIDSSYYDWASGITTDSSGNLYIAGRTDGSLAGGNAGSSDAFVAKYDSWGNQLWIRQSGTWANDVARSVATDAAGNVYVAGLTEGSLDGNLSAGGTDIFVTKYNNAGTKVWTRQLGSTASEGSISEAERNVAISVDSTGNIYVSGTTEGSLQGNTNAGGKDAFVAKYDTWGTRLWTRQLGTSGEDRSMGVAVDTSGNVHISGWTTGALDGKTNSGGTDAFVTKYDSSGNKLLTTLLGTTVTDASRDVAIDRNGNVYITGWTDGSLNGAGAGSHDSFVTKYAPLQPNRAPVVSASNQIVNVNQSMSPTFSVRDPDGNPISTYYFADNNSSSTSGYFTLNGVRQNSAFALDASQLSNVRFVGGGTAGTDNVTVWAYDGETWGNTSFNIETKQPNRAPILTASNQTVNVNQSMSPLFNVSDPDGNPISRYWFADGNLNSSSGYFAVNGVRQSSSFGVDANQLNTVRFIGGSAAGTDQVTVWAYDGQTWGSTSFNIDTKQANRAPVVNIGNQSVNANQSISPIFTATDADGDAITRYRFWDSNGASSSGYFTVNGVRQPAYQAIEVAANQLHTVRFVGGSIAGNDSLFIGAFDGKQWSNWQNFTINTTANPNPQFTSFSVTDASGDNTANTVFQGGALRFSYNLANTANLSNVRLEAVKNGSVVANLGTWNSASVSSQLVNLANLSNLTGGDYQIRAVARTTSGQEVISPAQSIKILSANRVNGTFAGETLTYAGGLGTGGVIIGRGGTDTLNLSGISRSSVTSINGMSLNSFNPWSGSTNRQAIFNGNALDYITLSDGREVYFQGIERLRFSDGSEMDLQIRPQDTYFAQQWNLHTTDVAGAWRFTRGSSNILLSSLDSGLTPPPVDIDSNRLILRSNGIDNDDYNDSGHGHMAISVMSSTTNNGSGVAGINWNSQVIVNDLYGGSGKGSRVSLFSAIDSSIKAARATGKKVVFQGGVQGESWLNDGATQAQLEQLIRDNSDIALFAVAAGNGAMDIDNNTGNPVFSGGVARLQTNHSNVMAVGALRPGNEGNQWWKTGQGIQNFNGLNNAISVNKAGYSNYGASLTLMAPTDSPSTTRNSPDPQSKIADGIQAFGGTSAANPNMAGIASLVWSVNSALTGGQVRQILIDTAMDLGTAGRDNTFGNGLVNADAAVRRAWALQRDSQLANLYSGRSVMA
ncbi:SBBP repeat-containing protein, partial [Microcoleus sp. B4-C5]|uniref:SBBP repeat-containing protein n=1 Tax=unclassified Microcoleus TaxID=2642155 RepID=UPI002FD1EA8D